MVTTQLELETVTPMFLHGHDNKIVELRPPPFKALFRYWWRTVQDCDTDSLWKNEAKLFGSTKGKAPFAIRISRKKDLQQTKYKPLPHKPDNDRLAFKADAYKSGQPFDLYLIAKGDSDASAYKQIAKLGFLLGGIGNRSRRGFGSIRETNWIFSDVSNLQDEVLKILNSVTEEDRFQINNFTINSRTVKIIEPKKSYHNPEFPVIQHIFFGKLTNNVNALLKKIGKATHNHDNDALGYAKGRNRLASPVHVHIQKIQNEYLPVATQLWSPYPNNRPPRDIQQKQQHFIYDIIK